MDQARVRLHWSCATDLAVTTQKANRMVWHMTDVRFSLLPLVVAVWLGRLGSLCATKDSESHAPSVFRVTIRKTAWIPRRAEPTKVSLPFAAGALQIPGRVILLDDHDKQVPSQLEVLARWPDGSIRWLLAHFLADVPADGKVTLTVRRLPGVGLDQFQHRPRANLEPARAFAARFRARAWVAA